MSNQVTGPGSLYDVDGTLIAAGVNMPAGAGAGRVLTSDASGGATWQPQNYAGIFGDGSDAAVTFDGSTTVLGMAPSSQAYTMTRDIFCTSITINNGVTLKPAGFRIFCAGTVTNNGTISAVGNAAAGSTAGASVTGTIASGTAGGAGGTGVSGAGANAPANFAGAAGGAGGAGTSGAAGAGGTVTLSAAAMTTLLRNPSIILTGGITYFTAFHGFLFGPGGGGGGSDASSNAGGGGGAGGGIVAIYAWAVNNGGGTITVAGGNGANGAAGNAGGGGGGSGGLIAIYTLSAWTAGTTVVAGGAKGTHAGTGSDGNNGGAGAVLNVVLT